MTCKEWIDEYQVHKHSKDHHSTFNGRKVYDPKLGELSVITVAQELEVHDKTVHYWLKTGRLKSVRKGSYHVIYREELQRFMAEEMEEKQENTQSA